MEHKIFVDHVKSVEFSFRLLVVALIFMAVCMGIMAMAFYKYVGWQKVVLVPPVIEKKIEIAGVNTSSEYVRSMVEFLAQTIMEYTPQDIQRRIDTVLFYANPKYAKRLQEQLDSLKTDIMQSGLSQLFRIEDIRVKTDGFAYLAGNIDRHVVGKPFWKNECKLRVQFDMNQGKFSLISLNMQVGPFDYKGKDAIFKGYDDI